MKAETLARLEQIARGETIPKSGGTAGTPGTLHFVPVQKRPSFQAFHVFQVEHDMVGNKRFEPGTSPGTCPLPLDIAEAERAAIAIELGRVPPAYAYSWAAFQSRKPGNVAEAEWLRAVDAAGRFLDEWASLALDFGWRPPDIFGPGGLAWFCAGERVRALGPDNAISASGRIFARLSLAEEITKIGQS